MHHLLSRLITFFLAFTFLTTSTHASPVPLDLLNSRDIFVEVVTNDNTNPSGLPERNVAVNDLAEWEAASFALTSYKSNSIESSVIAPLSPERRTPIAGFTPSSGGTPDWRRHSDSPH